MGRATMGLLDTLAKHMNEYADRQVHTLTKTAAHLTLYNVFCLTHLIYLQGRQAQFSSAPSSDIRLALLATRLATLAYLTSHEAVEKGLFSTSDLDDCQLIWFEQQQGKQVSPPLEDRR